MNIKEKIEVADPIVENLEPGQFYNLIGIINAQPEVKTKTQGEFLFRVPMRLGTKGQYTQAILEITSKRKIEEPCFIRRWMDLQIAVIRDCQFINYRENFGMKFLHFKLPSSPQNRYIFLTADEKDFWLYPLIKSEHPTNWRVLPKKCGDSFSFKGVVKPSNRSVFGSFWRDPENPEISTETFFNNTNFSDWREEVLALKLFFKAEGKRMLAEFNRKIPAVIPEGPLQMHMLKVKYTLATLLVHKNDYVLTAQFMEDFLGTNFDEESDTSEKESEHSDVDPEEFPEAAENESLGGECVGFDGDSERSEDEEMTLSDREFLDDQQDKENLPCSSHLALLNNARFEDDDLSLKRLFRRRENVERPESDERKKKRKLQKSKSSSE